MTNAILGFDTATPDVAVAVVEGDDVLAERNLAPPPEGRPRHATMLLATIEDLVSATGGWERIERIAVGVGPGSFTGLRIGITTATSLAYARSLPLAGVSSLAALAAGISTGRDSAPPCLPVIDARRGEAFAALYQGNEGEGAVWGPSVLSPAELAMAAEQAPTGTRAAGDGALRFRAELEAAGIEVQPDGDEAHRLSARYVCRLSAGAAAQATPPQPAYLRQPDAKLWRERDLGNP
ncbi:MAG: tRNA (adenosine(37)-N6)-threonylcarbamoyltransferase complex dimerization subunit type 1 TsaB [Solirubrobacterales bacterium]